MNHYVATVDLEVNYPNDALVYREVDLQKKVVVQFGLEFDFRSWGLKGIELTPIGTATVPLFVKEFSPPTADKATETAVDLTVDFAKLKVRFTSGPGNGCVCVESVELHLTGDWQVDYIKSELHAVR